MIVTAGAGDSHTQETASHYIHAVMPLIGAGYFDCTVIVIPRTLT